MYGLHQGTHHFQSFDAVRSLPVILNQTDDIWYGIIGKKHVGPDPVYPFPFSYTELDGYDANLVGRNITFMKEKVEEFLTEAQKNKKRFFLYIGIHDVHRCSGKLGDFCEKFGDGTSSGTGVIPDWKPVDYSPEDVAVPYYIQDTPQARADLANLYKVQNRMDQGVGLFLKALSDYGFENDTLIIFTSDNGIPFPNAKTNLYESGMGEPMIVASPDATRWGNVTKGLASTTDIVPTVLDWFNMTYPKYSLNGREVKLEGASLLPLLRKEPTSDFREVFSSHNMHEVTMYYPMRVLRDKRYRLLHNLNFKMPYPIAGDLFGSPTFQDLLTRTESKTDTHWFKDLHSYYYRSEWELYDLTQDSQELNNLVDSPSHQDILGNMKEKLLTWQNVTNDPWLCLPWGERVTRNGECSRLYNE